MWRRRPPALAASKEPARLYTYHKLHAWDPRVLKGAPRVAFVDADAIYVRNASALLSAWRAGGALVLPPQLPLEEDAAPLPPRATDAAPPSAYQTFRLEFSGIRAANDPLAFRRACAPGPALIFASSSAGGRELIGRSWRGCCDARTSLAL